MREELRGFPVLLPQPLTTLASSASGSSLESLQSQRRCWLRCCWLRRRRRRSRSLLRRRRCCWCWCFAAFEAEERRLLYFFFFSSNWKRMKAQQSEVRLRQRQCWCQKDYWTTTTHMPRGSTATHHCTLLL